MASMSGWCVLMALMMASGISCQTKVNFHYTNNAKNLEGGKIFDKVMRGTPGTLALLRDATSFVDSILFPKNDKYPVKNLTDVYFSVDDIDGVAYTVVEDSAIHLSADYIGNYTDDDLLKEIQGVVYHEMTHVWQSFGEWVGKGDEPFGLIEGIADYIRLKAKLAPGHWVQPGGGDAWDAGYDVTALFLDYCGSLKTGFVTELNGKMASKWNLNVFVELLGKPVDALWTDYKNKYS